MQLTLLDYVLTVEEATEPPIVPPVLIAGQRVKIIRVSTLPAALVGQVGTIAALIASDIVQVETDSGIWTIEASQVELLDGSVIDYGGKTEKPAPSSLVKWHQSLITHRRRTILRLSGKSHYADLIRHYQAEIEQTLEILEAAS